MFVVSLVNFISRKPEEFLVAKAIITNNVKANSGPANVVEKEYAGKKVPQICLRFAMIVGLM